MRAIIVALALLEASPATALGSDRADVPTTKQVRSMAVSAYALLVAHSAAMTGAWYAFAKFPWASAAGYSGESPSKPRWLLDIWVSGLLAASVTYATAQALLIVSYQKSLGQLGQRPVDPVSVLGWVLFGATGTTLALVPAFEWFLMPAMFLYPTSIGVGIGLGVLALANMKKAERSVEPSTMSLVPCVFPVRGGAAAGVTGVF